MPYLPVLPPTTNTQPLWHHLTALSSEGIGLILWQRSKGVVDVTVACLICPYCQDQVPHGGIRCQVPVGLRDGWGGAVRPQAASINVLQRKHMQRPNTVYQMDECEGSNCGHHNSVDVTLALPGSGPSCWHREAGANRLGQWVGWGGLATGGLRRTWAMSCDNQQHEKRMVSMVAAVTAAVVLDKQQQACWGWGNQIANDSPLLQVAHQRMAKLGGQNIPHK